MKRLDKLKAEIADMDAEEMAKLLHDNACHYCIHQSGIGICIANCLTGAKAYLKQEIKPQKTLADVFFERNPKANKEKDGVPFCCPDDIGLNPNPECDEEDCVACWDRPYEESDNE